MANCANISLEKVRARISFGPPGGPTSLTFETPDIKSFSVGRNRGTLSAQFSASIELPATIPIPAGEDLIIEAGVAGNLIRIFTGRVLSVTVNPSFENASRYIINLAGQDRFHELEGKNISRRQRARSLSQFAAITGVTSRAPQKSLSFEKRQQSGGDAQIVSLDTNLRENSKLVRTDRVAWDPLSPAKEPESVEADGSANTTGEEVIDIKPRAISASPGVSVIFNIENATYEQGDSWAVSDSAIGRIQDRFDGTAIYTQLAIGENTISFTKKNAGGGSSIFIGKATVTSVIIHDHSSLGEGGPAFGVFSSD